MYFSKKGKNIKAIAMIGISLIFCGSVAAYADVADPWPGPRPHSHDEREMDSASLPEVSFGIEENGQMAMYFHFNTPCQYQYAVRIADSDEMVTYGKGKGNKDDTEQDTFSYESPRDGMTSHYILELAVTFQRQTRFGHKLSTNRMEKHVYVQKVDGEDHVRLHPAWDE